MPSLVFSGMLDKEAYNTHLPTVWRFKGDEEGCIEMGEAGGHRCGRRFRVAALVASTPYI